jgi:hypothetical protein
MTSYGQPVDMKKLDSYGEEAPEEYTGFAIYLLEQ